MLECANSFGFSQSHHLVEFKSISKLCGAPFVQNMYISMTAVDSQRLNIWWIGVDISMLGESILLEEPLEIDDRITACGSDWIWRIFELLQHLLF